MDLLHPTGPLVIDFLLSFWDEGLMAERICGYHSALASVFQYSKCSVFDGPKTAPLLKNFTLERSWSLYLVLSFLKGATFEPLEDISLEDLTRKTVFLTVLASGRHSREVHSVLGLLYAVSF